MPGALNLRHPANITTQRFSQGSSFQPPEQKQLMRDYRLVYSETSKDQIARLHPGLKPVIRSRLDTLQGDPFIGKKLERELAGYRSLRAKRFRILYKVNESGGIVEIHYVGHRKDIYELFAEKAGGAE
jgi:mRNA interferase RelE/StbE